MRNRCRPPKGNQRKKKHILQNVLRKTYERFVKIRGKPREIALGFALGIFIGMTPTMGIQMPVAVFFAAMLKWSKISAAFGVWITNPFTAPFIYGITYIIGAAVLGLETSIALPEDFTWSIIKETLKNAPAIFGAMTLGGILIGLPLAIFCYFLSYAAVNKYQQRVRDQLAAQKARLANTKESVKKKIRKRRKKQKASAK